MKSLGQGRNIAQVGQVARYFFRLGLTGFGGPIALVTEMQQDLVHRHQWMAPHEFQRALPFLKSMPGPLAFQTAVFLGRHRAGRWGGFLAGLMLVLPAFVLMLLLAMGSARAHEWPWLQQLLRGCQVAALGLILGGLPSLAQGLWKRLPFWLWGFVAAVGSFHFPGTEPLWILGAGTLSALSGVLRLNAAEPATLISLVAVCLKAGALVFGTGLAIVPLLEADVVTRTGWLTHDQFLQALSFGQLTPGPVLITVTYVGWVVAGGRGAVLSTAAVFLPALVHMLTWFPGAVGWMARQTWIERFTLGAIAAVTGVILVAVIHLGDGLSLSPFEFVFLAGAAALVLARKLPSWAVILGVGATSAILAGLLSSSF